MLNLSETCGCDLQSSSLFQFSPFQVQQQRNTVLLRYRKLPEILCLKSDLFLFFPIKKYVKRDHWHGGFTVATHLSVAVSAGMLQRKVKEMMMKRNERKAGMWWQELPHFPDRAKPSSPQETLPTTQLHPEYI